jgi:hypothetical protein
MLNVLLILNLIAVAAIIRRFRLRYAGLPVLAFYVAVALGLPGSFLTLDGDDWWLLSVSTESIQRAAVLYNLGIVLWAGALMLSNKTPLPIPVPKKGAPAIVIALFVGLSITSAVIALAILFPDSPLFYLLKDRDVSPLALAELRGQLNVDFQGGALALYFRNLVIRYLTPFIAIYFGLLYHQTGRHKIWYGLTLATAAFTLSIDLSKGPILSLVLLVGMIRFAAGKISPRQIAVVAAVFLGATVILYTVIMGSESGQVAEEVAHRLFVAQYVGVPVTVEVFPRVAPYIDLGSVLGQLGKLFGFDYVFYSRITMDYANPWGVTAGTAGYLSTFAAAEGYAVDGIAGYFVSLGIVFAFLLLLDRHFRKSEDMKWRAFYILLAWKLPLLIMDSASGMIINYGVLLVYLLLKFCDFIELRKPQPQMRGILQ